jgi:hypothetical protein
MRRQLSEVVTAATVHVRLFAIQRGQYSTSTRGSVPTSGGASSPPSSPLDSDDLAELAGFGAPGLGLCESPAVSSAGRSTAAKSQPGTTAAAPSHGHPVVDVGALLTPRAALRKFAGARFKRNTAIADMRAALMNGGPGYFYATGTDKVLSSEYIESVYEFSRELHCASLLYPWQQSRISQS